ncbi:PREDICTED: natural killer cell receptor 2B4 [Ficedula albicollis]|uniref:CD244 molecule n=1 Tax=Ficedula albicollis TaxID=59894 RepID=A0A803VH48_FICAL|nr:PREDICTED: natural killer cell receptor 2B4 [Ficedula albicollis]
MGMGNGPCEQEWPRWPRGLPWGDNPGIPGSELQECRDRAVTAGGSLCLEPEEPPWEWKKIHWRAEMDLGSRWRILMATRDGHVSYPKGPFHGRAEFQPGVLSLCISPVHKADSRVYTAEFENSSGSFPISPQCFRVSVWDPIPEPSLESQILQRDRGWCRLSLLCSSPGNGNVSISWECPEEPPESPKIPKSTGSPNSTGSPKSPSQRLQWIPEDAEPQICLCNLSNAAGWKAAPAPLTCAGIPGNFGLWAALGGAAGLSLILILILGVCWRRRRKENSREDPPGAPAGPPDQPLTVYAEVGAKNPTRTREVPVEGATIYAVVTPRTLENPRQREEPGDFTVYATVQRPPSIKKKRLDRALVSTAYLEDNGDYRRLGSPNPKRP